MRREEESSGYRHGRLEGLILEELRSLLRDDVADPALDGVQITAATLSVDYRHARVHFAVRGDGRGEGSPDTHDARRRVERSLARATPFLRARLADAIDLRRVPDLRFVFDAVAPAGP